MQGHLFQQNTGDIFAARPFFIYKSLFNFLLFKRKKKITQPNRTAIVQMVVEKMESRTNSYTMI